MSNQILQTPGWSLPRGYVNGVAARGTLVFVAGQIGWNARCEFEIEVTAVVPDSVRSTGS